MPTKTNKDIIDNFNRNARTYDEYAVIQKKIAHLLHDHVVEQTRSYEQVPPTKILELGCGTGFLTTLLLTTFPNADITITDSSQTMIDLAQKNLQKQIKNHKGTIKFAILNVEEYDNPLTKIKYDLIVSSMLFQWLKDPITTLCNWRDRLSKTGIIAVSTLGSASFKEVKKLAEEKNICLSLHNYPHYEEYQKNNLIVYGYNIFARYSSLSLFFKTLIKTGAGTPAVKSNSPLALRQLLRKHKSSILINWDVILVSYSTYGDI